MWSCEYVSGTTVSQQSRNMSPRNVCRSFAISVAIIILFLESPINGLSIRRTSEQKEFQTPIDLIAEESTLLEVKTDLKRPNDIKIFETKTDQTAEKLAATENIQDNSEVNTSVRNTNTRSQNAKIYDIKKSKRLNNNETLFLTTASFNENIKISTETVNNDATEIPKITVENEENKKEINNMTKPGSSSNSDLSSKETSRFADEDKLTETTFYKITSVAVKQTNLEITETPFHSSSSNSKVITHIIDKDVSRKNTQSPELQVTSTPLKLHINKSDNTQFLKDFEHTSHDVQLDKEDERLTKDSTTSQIMYTGKYSDDNNRASDEEIATKILANLSLDPTPEATKEMSTNSESTLNESEISSIAHVDINNSDATYPFSVDTNSTSAETLISTKLDTPGSNALSWKNYTVIDRNHSTTTEDVTPMTNYETEMTRAETSQTRYIFDKSFSITSLLSSGELGGNKMNINNRLLYNQSAISSIQQPTENELALTSSMSPDEIPQTRFGTVSSMRAGFLDYSGKATTPSTTVHENNEETFGIMYESMDLGENDKLEHKNISVIGTQSQLSEDAIKEELLKEEMINDKIENIKRSRDDRDDSKFIKTFDVNRNSTINKQSSEVSKERLSEDTLSVQPISHEQGKNMDLYVVSPNYKPMKRIEVQPAKPFLRDPDDNSWRNVSISSLGIVFKPKNSSKSLTQVLKNKTETELGSYTDRDSKTGLPDLRERLEKIAEVRKSKKKRVNKHGDTVYSDYEENRSSGETVTTIKVVALFTVNSTDNSEVPTTTVSPITSSVISESTQTTPVEKETTKVIKENIFKSEERDPLTTQTPPQKLFNIAEYYDTTDEYDADYLTLSKIDIKKFTIPATTETTVTSPTPSLTKPLRLPERKPTVEYFPPRVTSKIYDYDNDFQKKINLYDVKENTKPTTGSFYGASPTIATYEDKEEFDKKVKPIEFPLNRHEHINLNKHLYLTEIPEVTSSHNGFDTNDGNFNRASYVIKHYRDFINAAAKDDDDKNVEYVALTESPIRGSTLDEIARLRVNRVKPIIDRDYDYQLQYRKNVLNKLVNDFNQNSEKYKVDFPILFNKNIDNRKYQVNGNVLSPSNTFTNRFYENPGTATKPNFSIVKPCDPNCDKLTVELSPAYELHYYVPDQEEKQVAELRPRTVSYRYRL